MIHLDVPDSPGCTWVTLMHMHAVQFILHYISPDCWQLSRNSTGHIEPDPTRFPDGSSGMRDLGAYLHGLDLKFGIYTDLGSMTCQRRPGSHRHEVCVLQF